MKKYTIILMLIILSFSCKGKAGDPKSVPVGKWEYRLLMNNTEIGNATISNEFKEGKYFSSMEMSIKTGTVVNKTRQLVAETKEFKPIKLEVYNTTIVNNKEQDINTIADFKGNTVTLNTGDAPSAITITKPFVIGDNYLTDALLKKNFKPKTEVSYYLYDPSVETDEPILIKATVVGREKTEINGPTKELIHVAQSMGNVKNIHSLVDDNGVVQKTLIIMLNNRIELIIK